jgi:hypothetical protein
MKEISNFFFIDCKIRILWLRAGRSGDRSPVGLRLSAPVQTGYGAHPASCTIGIGSFPEVESGRGVTLTPHPFLVPRSTLPKGLRGLSKGWNLPTYVLVKLMACINKCGSHSSYLQSKWMTHSEKLLSLVTMIFSFRVTLAMCLNTGCTLSIDTVLWSVQMWYKNAWLAWK